MLNFITCVLEGPIKALGKQSLMMVIVIFSHAGIMIPLAYSLTKSEGDASQGSKARIINDLLISLTVGYCIQFILYGFVLKCTSWKSSI